MSSLRYAEQAESEETAEFPNSRITLAASHRGANRKPDLVAHGRPVHALQHKFKVEAEFEFGDDDQGRRTMPHRHRVAAVDLALYLETESFKEPLNGKIEGGLQKLRPSSTTGLPRRLASAEVRSPKFDA